MQYFNIQVASQLSGVASATIRAWEKRYNAVIPERAENKHRIYSEKDIEKLALLYKLIEYGQSIGKIAHLELSELKEVYTTLLHRPYEERSVVTPHHGNVDFEKVLSSFQLALLAYKLDIISHEFEKTINLLSPRELCLHILLPLFREIGIKVASGEMGISQEHALSAIVKFHIGQVISRHYQSTPPIKDSMILITTPEGELHEIGILASALLCVHYGVKFLYLGPNLPGTALTETINALKPQAVILGSMRDTRICDYVSSVSREIKVKTEFWVGGVLSEQTERELTQKSIPNFSNLPDLDSYLKRFYGL